MFDVVRAANGYDSDGASDAARFVPTGESLTIQSQRDEADINVLVRRFGLTGQLPVREMPEALVGHVERFDMMEAQNLLVSARESFQSLDATVRERFGNDPMKFVQFCGDKDNLAELRKLGLAKPEVVVPPEVIQKVQVVEVSDGDGEGASGRGGRAAAGARGARKADPVKD